MSSFTDPLVVEVTQKEVEGRGVARLVQPFDYYVGGLENPTRIIHIPAGYETDFMSVPPGFRNLVAVFDKFSKAAVVHDYLLTEWDKSKDMSLTDINKIFREALLVLGASKIRAEILFLAVQGYTHLKAMFGGKFKNP